jgi:hypothetical protein
MEAKIDDMVADRAFVVAREADGIYLFHRDGPPLPSFPVEMVAGETMFLERVDVAVMDQWGGYQPSEDQPVPVSPGQRVRVSLYWTALDAPGAERTVSVRMADSTGALVAQYDNLPGRGKKPTSWWEKGWQIRDVYYLDVASHAPPGPARIDVLVYDNVSGETVPFENGGAAHVCEVRLVPSF